MDRSDGRLTESFSVAHCRYMGAYYALWEKYNGDAVRAKAAREKRGCDMQCDHIERYLRKSFGDRLRELAAVSSSPGFQEENTRAILHMFKAVATPHDLLLAASWIIPWGKSDTVATSLLLAFRSEMTEREIRWAADPQRPDSRFKQTAARLYNQMIERAHVSDEECSAAA